MGRLLSYNITNIGPGIWRARNDDPARDAGPLQHSTKNALWEIHVKNKGATSSERRGGPYPSTRGRGETPLSAEVGRGVRGRDDVQRHHKDLEKAEALERRAKTKTMRTESLMTTEADVFKTLLDRQEEAKKHVNEPSAQLSQQNTTVRSTHWKWRSAEQDKEEETSTRSLSFALFKFRGVIFSPDMSNEFGSEEWCFEVRRKGVGSKQPRPSDEMCSVSSDSSSATDATSDRCHGTFATRVASSQSTRRLCETSRWGRGKAHHCFAWFSRDVRDAGGSLVERKHERAHSRMAGQRLVETVAGDPRSDRHLDTAIDVRVARQPFFFSLDGRPLQGHLQAERRKRLANAWLLIGTEHIGLPRTRKGEAELKRRSTGRGAADDFSSSRRALSTQIMMLEGSSWDGMWPFQNVQKSCRCTLLQEFNDATKCGPYCDLFFFLEAWHAAMWRNQYSATREHWEPFLRASLGVPSPSPKLDFPLEMTTWARARLLTPAWSSSSGPNGPGAGSVRFTHWSGICSRVSCVIGATHILKGCQSLSHAVTHFFLLPKTAHSDSQSRYKGRRSAGGHG